ncbi:hypothetical protein NDU88_004509 [Pleurodeles waltl]|uniref:Uncharacterized protein n=1 Tax=Pleurodeles waltl TaxID=8319 RepID=A0AAV7V1E4_PLEWA|nr:hypothetical protein NDU88_004509 [Pleurodeles waltl]
MRTRPVRVSPTAHISETKVAQSRSPRSQSLILAPLNGEKKAEKWERHNLLEADGERVADCGQLRGVGAGAEACAERTTGESSRCSWVGQRLCWEPS